MKSDWKIVSGADFIDFNPRLSLKKGSVATKIAMDKLHPFTKKIPESEQAAFSGGAKFANGDTIMARITPCLENGKTAFVDCLAEGEIAFGSTEFIVLRAKEGVSDERFLYYLAISPDFRDLAIKSMVGTSGRQRVQQSVLETCELRVPPLETQRKIAAILSALDDKIELNRRINANLEQQAAAIYSAMFTENDSLKTTSGVLNDIAVVTMGQSPKGDSYNEDGVGEVFYQGRAEFGFRFPTRRLFTTEPKRIAEKDDVLLSVRAPVGDINVAYERCCIGRGLASIRSKGEDSSYLLYTMFALKPKLELFNGEGTVFGSVNRDALNSTPISIPEMSKIKEFETLVRPVDNLIRTNYEETRRLQTLRDALLPRLMSGEIDVSDVSL